MNSEPPVGKFSFRERRRSFQCALRGVVWMLKSEHNAKLHLAATIFICSLGGVLRVSLNDWCWLVTAVAMVWVAESLNTAFEHLADVAAPEIHPTTARAKDVAAGAVLIASLAAAAIGLLVLGPHLWQWLQS
jgi:diacylglycerol kinase (ATP)